MAGEEALLTEFLQSLSEQGHPTIRIVLRDRYDLGAEFFRWEAAVAIAAIALEVNPFDQPDVEGAKLAARSLMQAFEESGALPAPLPILEAEGMTFYSDSGVGERAPSGDPGAAVAAHLARLAAGDYFAINAYLASSPRNDAELQALREMGAPNHGSDTADGVAS